jgi:hypothetical protein
MSAPLTEIFSKISKLTPLAAQNFLISGFVPGSCSLKLFAGKARTFRPLSAKRRWSFSRFSY